MEIIKVKFIIIKVVRVFEGTGVFIIYVVKVVMCTAATSFTTAANIIVVAIITIDKPSAIAIIVKLIVNMPSVIDTGD